MYDVEGDHIVGEPQRALVGGVRALTFSGDGSLLITTSDDGTLALWSESDGPTLLSQPIGDGERLLGVSESGEVVVLGGTVYAKVHRPGSAPEDPVDIRLAGLLSAAVGRDRATLWRLSAGGSAVFAAVVVAGVTTHMFVFDSRTGELLWSHDDPRHVYGPEISGDGRLVAVPIDDELIEIWDVGTGEKIAEFAVDLEFAFTFDRGVYTNSPPTPQFESYAFGAAQNATFADLVPGAVPQRIRSVRVRFSTRSAVADRITDFRISEQNKYTVRYCLNPAGCTAGNRDWARVRTMTTEVSLPNHARHFY